MDQSDPNKVNVHIRNKIHKGDTVDILSLNKPARESKILEILDDNGNELSFAQPNSQVFIVLDTNCLKNDLLRLITETGNE